MYEQIIPSIAKTISGIFISLSILFGATPAPAQAPIIPEPQIIEHTNTILEKPIYLGTNISSIADFRTSLNAGIDNSTTTMTLVSFYSGSDSLVVGETYGFKIGGREYVLGTAAENNKITGMTRGLSRKTATTTFSSYKQAWGRGTSVEITDAPLILDLGNKLTGKAGIDTPIRYDSSVATTSIDDNNANLVNYELLTYTAFNGAAVINASQTQKGLVEIATQLETASSTPTGSTGATLVIPASNATSTYNSATASLRAVVTDNTGKIDDDFIPTTIGNAHTFTGALTTNTITSTGLTNIASTSIYATTTSGTWTKPANLRYLIVEVCSGGGGGGGVTSNSSYASGGGGAGVCASKIIPATSVGSTEVVTIGSFGAGGSGANNGATGGTTSFGSHISATGGEGGRYDTGNLYGGLGGIPTGSDINLVGMSGFSGQFASNNAMSGFGGSCKYGSGGRSQRADSAGESGLGFCSGGSGASGDTSSPSASGGNGTPGIIIFTYVFY